MLEQSKSSFTVQQGILLAKKKKKNPEDYYTLYSSAELTGLSWTTSNMSKKEIEFLTYTRKERKKSISDIAQFPAKIISWLLWGGKIKMNKKII